MLMETAGIPERIMILSNYDLKYTFNLSSQVDTKKNYIDKNAPHQKN